MKIIKADINKVDLNPLVNKITRGDHKPLFLQPPGENHYGLLAYLSMQLGEGFVVELGTHHGTSSLAMSINPKVSIRTYDIQNRYGIKGKPENVECRVGNIFSMKEEHYLLEADLIFLDTAHTGDFEQQVYDYLLENDYKGLLLLDDIHWNGPMKKFWAGIKTTKFDLTDIGHGTCPDGIAGTGLVDFGGKVQLLS